MYWWYVPDLRDFYHRSQVSIPEACGSKPRTMAAYRFRWPYIGLFLLVAECAPAPPDRLELMPAPAVFGVST